MFTITPAKIGALIGMNTAPNTVSGLFEAARIHSVKLWASADTSSTQTGPPPMVSIEWAGPAGITGPNFVESDYTVGLTHVAKVCSRPRVGTQASQWQATNTGSTQTWFILTMSGQSIIDIDVTHTVASATRANFNVTTTAAGSLGQIYYLALDNPAGGTGSVSNQIVPENSLLTIA